MFFKQYFLGCLAQASYMVGDQGEAAVIDPRRDVEIYLEEAKANGLIIAHIIETHLHADFVSGHLELAKRTGAKIYFGRQAKAQFDHVGVRDGQEIRMGKVVLRFLETPGHTPESISVLVVDETKGKDPQMILTGDTLFIGEVGRPDLVSSKGYSAETMAGMLYDSLWQKILPLPDATLVYPAHGAGSACGKQISSQPFSTLGEQRVSNYALRKMPKEEFVRMATADLPDAPQYFSHDADLNRRGALALNDLPPLKGFSPQEVLRRLQNGEVVLDVRSAHLFGAKHLYPSLNIGLSGWFASWCGTVVGPKSEMMLLGESAEEIEEARMRLARVGLEKVSGYVEGGVAAWERAGFPCARIEQISPADLEGMLKNNALGIQVLDVRGEMEFRGGHIGGAMHLPLDQFSKGEHRLNEFDAKKPVAVICGSGYRSSIACGLLEKKGWRNLYNVVGGMKAWIAEGRKLA